MATELSVAPPHDPPSERAVLDAVMLRPWLLSSPLLAALAVDDLYVWEHRATFKAMLAVYRDDRELHVGFFYLALCNEMDVNGPGRRVLGRLADPPPVMATREHSLRHHVAKIKDCAHARALISAAHEIAEAAWRACDERYTIRDAERVLRRLERARVDPHDASMSMVGL